MHRFSWLWENASTLLMLAGFVILLFAWPMENVYACVVAAVMLAVATVMKIWAHFHPVRYAQ